MSPTAIRNDKRECIHINNVIGIVEQNHRFHFVKVMMLVSLYKLNEAKLMLLPISQSKTLHLYLALTSHINKLLSDNGSMGINKSLRMG